MAIKFQIKYQCGHCEDNHSYYASAENCCAPKVFTVYLCEICGEEYDHTAGAKVCCTDEDDSEEEKIPLAYLEENAGQQRLF